VKCNAPEDFGHHFVPIALYFERKDKHSRPITEVAGTTWNNDFILRFLSLHVIHGTVNEAENQHKSHIL